MKGKPVPKVFKHGLSGYNNYYCRCKVCRAANYNYAYTRQYRLRGPNRGPNIGKCNFCGEEKSIYSRGLCTKHYDMIKRLIKVGIRTEEELVIGGYLNEV